MSADYLGRNGDQGAGGEDLRLPKITGELVVPDVASAAGLAALLDCPTAAVIADLIELRIMATVNQALDFETAGKVLRRHGFAAKRQS